MSNIEKDLNPDVFIGVSLPLDYGSQGFFNKTRTTLEQTRSNIRNLLLTIKGERLGNPTFGSDLMRIIFDQDAGDIGDRIEEAIRTSISEWLPYVTVEQVETVTDERNPNLLNVSINFTIDIDQRVEQLDLNLKLADQGTIGQVGGESMYDELTDSIIGDGEYDTLDPFYSL
jgi:phage baseplate assembly protein W